MNDMKTPICDFVREYANGGTLRLHMPGHKGKGETEAYDITEIAGADSLFEADGIIAESERNASELFGADTFYSTEGSSLSIRAMLYLAQTYAKEKGKARAKIAAGRNAHKTFLSAAALLDLDVVWLYSENDADYLSFEICADKLEVLFEDECPDALYLTSPDYLGNTLDITEIKKACRKYGVLLLVDNAHGAYLKFLSPSRHPIDLGADMCSDSAHKTLPVLTGGAYLHISKNAPRMLSERARDALALFGSTSPSYLILQSLDRANRYLSDGYSDELARLCKILADTRARLEAAGYVFSGDEPTKLTVCPRTYGYTGDELAELLRAARFECEFADPDYTVMMFTPEISEEDIKKLEAFLLSLTKKEEKTKNTPDIPRAKCVMSVREAMLSPAEALPVRDCLGRVLAAASVACPPAVPILVCGEEIDERAIELFEYYGIDKCTVVK